MRHWLRRVRGALLVGVTWALAWGIGGGGLMELIFDPDGRIADIWPMVLGIPGFFAGIIFSVVLAATERHRSFDELSLPRFGAWGAVAGVLLGLLGMVVFGAGPLALVPLSLLGAASASGFLALARGGHAAAKLGAGANMKNKE